MCPLPIRPSLDDDGPEDRSPSGLAPRPRRIQATPPASAQQPVVAPTPAAPQIPVADLLAEDEAPLMMEPPTVVVPQPQPTPQPQVAQAPVAAPTPTAAPAQAPEPSSDEYEDDDLEDIGELEEERIRREQIASLSVSAKENAQRLLERIADDESSEVLLNGPNEIMFKVNGQRYYDKSIKFEDVDTYHTVINTLILFDTDTKERIGTTQHLIEGQLELPDYDDPDAPALHARVHVLAPPAVKVAKVTIAKKAKKQFQIDDLAGRGAMSPQMASFLKAIGRGRATIVFSGLSGSGKTTLLEAMSYNFDENDRVIVVEDTAELSLPLADVVPLRSTSRKPGQDASSIVSLEWLVAQANRMRPDRIIVGEIRGGELVEFLSAANSGADGSMTTVHASSPRQTIDKMLSLAMKSGSAKNESSVLRDIASTVQIIVQMSLIDGGRHVISQIEEVTGTLVGNGTGIATAPLFQFDRSTQKFVAVGRPTDNLQRFLNQRGVALDNSWFSRTM